MYTECCCRCCAATATAVHHRLRSPEMCFMQAAVLTDSCFFTRENTFVHLLTVQSFFAASAHLYYTCHNHYGHARRRRWASPRRGKYPLARGISFLVRLSWACPLASARWCWGTFPNGRRQAKDNGAPCRTTRFASSFALRDRTPEYSTKYQHA